MTLSKVPHVMAYQFVTFGHLSYLCKVSLAQQQYASVTRYYFLVAIKITGLEPPTVLLRQ